MGVPSPIPRQLLTPSTDPTPLLPPPRKGFFFYCLHPKASSAFAARRRHNLPGGTARPRVQVSNKEEPAACPWASRAAQGLQQALGGTAWHRVPAGGTPAAPPGQGPAAVTAPGDLQVTSCARPHVSEGECLFNTHPRLFLGAVLQWGRTSMPVGMWVPWGHSPSQHGKRLSPMVGAKR